MDKWRSEASCVKYKLTTQDFSPNIVAAKAAARKPNWGRLEGIFSNTFALDSRCADFIAQISSHAIKSGAHLVR
jgi:hypothetical protein